MRWITEGGFLICAFRLGPKEKIKNGTLSPVPEVPGGCDDDQDVGKGKPFQSILQYFEELKMMLRHL